MIVRWLNTSIVGILLIATGVPSAAQAGPPCGPDLPIKCTPGKDAAILAGIAGAGALAIFLAYRMDHPRAQASVEGCTALVEGVIVLSEQGTQSSYLLTGARKNVKTGERVVLRGKKSRNATGKSALRVTKVVKDEGPCEPQDVGQNNPK